MGEAVGVVLAAEQFALPQGVVRVLHGQRLPAGCCAGQACGVGGAQVAGQRGHGPAVAGAVVQHQDQDVIVRVEGEQVCADGEFAGKVESGGDCLADGFGEFGLTVDLPLGPRNLRRGGTGHDLVCLAVGHREEGPQ